jgi:hypothetical protein
MEGSGSRFGSGSVQIIMDLDPGGPMTNDSTESGPGTLVSSQ